jgi:hypothetical protein
MMVFGETVNLTTTGNFTYNDLLKLAGEIENFKMTTLLVSSNTLKKILAFEEMREMPPSTDGRIFTPFGAEIIQIDNFTNNYLIGLNKYNGCELITTPEVIVETDRLIATQMDCINISISAAVKGIFKKSVRQLSLTS